MYIDITNTGTTIYKIEDFSFYAYSSISETIGYDDDIYNSFSIVLEPGETLFSNLWDTAHFYGIETPINSVNIDMDSSPSIIAY